MSATEQLDSIFSKYPGAGRDALIPILQAVQEKLGYLSKEAVIGVAQRLNLPASKVYGVATFYNQFRFQPLGRFNIQVCRGTACHVKGSAAVLEAMKQALGVEAGQTTKDGMFSIEVVACIGACGLAPVISVNGEFFAGVTPDSVRQVIKSFRKKAEDEHGK
ncbi:TPA: NADH-quinone oxidoreductase subunit NuoE [Candidatus Sumerlaeota bacterium]|jgi:NADH-quinone oxidoreductase subunit E|nr:NADH-quinone oxidoreductase subunit NuoE [Candidatus Sumerlaeota bacterium]